jgi:hypothetical protein
MYKKIRPALQCLTVFVGITLLFLGLASAINPSVAAAHTLVRANGSAIEPELLAPVMPSSASLQASSLITYYRYFPIINKSNLVYEENFSNDKSGWFEGADSSCDSSYDSGRYRLDVDAEDECFRPAPSGANRTYGSFEVLNYLSEGGGDMKLGLYLNGSGGNNYYLLLVRPNKDNCSGGGWEFIRNKNGTKNTLRSENCSSVVKRGKNNNNILRVRHGTDGLMTLIINGVTVASFNDGNALTGTGTGVYARGGSESFIGKFDDFRVFLP